MCMGVESRVREAGLTLGALYQVLHWKKKTSVSTSSRKRLAEYLIGNSVLTKFLEGME